MSSTSDSHSSSPSSPPPAPVNSFASDQPPQSDQSLPSDQPPQQPRNSIHSQTSYNVHDSHEIVYQETTAPLNIDNSSPPTNNKIKNNLLGSQPKSPNRRGGSLKKYKNELKHLLPYRETGNGPGSGPNETSGARLEDYAAKIDEINCFQFIFFTWMSPVVRRIFTGKFSLNDIQQCSPYDSCLQNSRRFKQVWENECGKRGLHNASLERTLFRFIRTRFIVSSFFYVLCLIAGYLSSTYFVKKLLEEIEISLATGSNQPATMSPDALIPAEHRDFDQTLTNATPISISSSSSLNTSPTMLALYWTAALCLCELFRAISYSIMFGVTIRTGIRAVNALAGTLYDKILSKRPYGGLNSQPDQSQPTNLFANDLGKVFQLIYMLPLMIGSPIIILVTIVYSFHLIGHSAVVGMVLFVLIFGLQGWLTKVQARLRDQLMTQSDARIGLVTQLMRDIRTIKFNAWEKPFQSDILYCRNAESRLLVKYQYLQCFSTSLALLTPMLITIINIVMHTWLGNDLSVSTAFSLVMLNYIAAHGIRSLPNYLREIVNGRVALERLERFLRLDDQESYLRLEVTNPVNAIEIADASFSWAPGAADLSQASPAGSNRNSQSFRLSNISLNVPKRTHLCLYGPVGSGKTALLMSILGQTQCFKGEVRLASDRLAYVPQTAWLQNATIRDNILFGSPFDRKRYYETLIKCQLAQDISQLADGEYTVVGENGRQLSGGQKQRIQLARAVYSNADIYLFDDLFSALDARVVKTIFASILQDMLRSKTVIFITRHLHLLPSSTLVAMLQDGQIRVVGEHAKLLEENVEYREAVDRSKLMGSSSGHEEVKSEIPVRDSLEIAQSEEEDPFDSSSDSDDNSENVLFGQTLNRPLAPQPHLSATSYTSLISLLEKCDQNNNKQSGKPQDTAHEDDEEALDPETRHFRKYSKKYRKKFGGSRKSTPGSFRRRSLAALQTQAISWSTYLDYIRASGGGTIFSIMVAIFAVQMATSTFSSWWLSYWLAQGSGEHPPLSDQITKNPAIRYYQACYLALCLIVIVTSLAMGCMFARLVIRAANALHSGTLARLIRSPLAFYDTISLGRILALFSHNVDELDSQLPIALDGFIQRALLVLGTFFLIIWTLNWFSLPFALFCVLFVLVYRLYRCSTYWLKQADMRLRSPIYSFIQATIDGLTTVKAFRAEQRFTRDFYSIADRHSAAQWLSHCNVRWLSIRIDLLCIVANVLVCVLVLVNLESVGAAYAGLVITQSMQLSGLLQFVVRLALDLETRLVSVERMQAYIRLLRVEPPTTLSPVDNLPDDWPQKGEIDFRDVSLRYRTNLPLALEGVSLHIAPHSKVAIVGRTGAGKSSLTYALFRLVEACAGAIYIDGVDIRTVPLELLRTRLSVIPQDPVLFQATVRKNLDPSGRANVLDLWRVLELVGLKDRVAAFGRGVDEVIAGPGGGGRTSRRRTLSDPARTITSSSSNQFSTGEKQLLCLARALLRKSRIIVLDEATAAVDDATEKHIWRLIETIFADCTVVLIAHRLQTVLKCDQVVVLRKGQVIECGTPNALRDDARSLFARMIQSTNRSPTPQRI